MKNLKYMLLFAALVLATASCDNRNIRQVVKELSEAPVDTAGMTAVTIKTNDFTSVEIDCFADVTYHQTDDGTAPSVTLKARKEVLQNMSNKVDDGELEILIDRRYRMPEKAVIVIDIYAPFVSKFSINGGKCLRLGKINISSPLDLSIDGVGSMTADTINAPEITASLNGAGSVDLKGITANRIAADLNGAGEITLSGSSGETRAEINGTGTIDLSQLKSSGRVSKKINGAGTVR